MAELTKLSNRAANTAADAIGSTMDSGFVHIFDGTRPATADTASTGVLLARLTLNADAFAASSTGRITANAISDDASADATGTATWFRVTNAATSQTMFDGDVGTAGANLNLNSVAISSGATVSVTALTFDILKST